MRVGLIVVSLLAALCIAAAPAPKDSPSATPAAPPLPKIVSIELLPATMTLDHARDARKVLVIGKSASGQPIDLTAAATFKPESDAVTIDKDGYVRGAKPGQTSVSITAAGQTAKLPVTVKTIDNPPVGFVADVQPILSRVGCNAGTCHGSANGKEGFKLSLRGYDTEHDYQQLINDLSARRFDRLNPDESLMLKKPAGGVAHEGGKVLDKDSEHYAILRQWIAEGTQDQSPAARVVELEVLPKVVYLDQPGMSHQVVVLAKYRDGSTRDVTRDAIMEASNIEVLQAKGNTITALRRGEGAVLIRYEGAYATRQVFVMGDRSGYAWKDEPEANYVDTHVHAKLRQMKILPSPLCTDADFIRRIHLDLTGQPATGERVKAFLADPAPGEAKRTKVVDELLAGAEYTDYWSNKWADLLQCNSKTLGPKALWHFRGYIRDSIATNKPYDQFVRELLLARGSSFQHPEVNYYRTLKENGKITEDVSQTFLGVRFNCNKCHDHPFEKWTQNQYYEFGAFFSTIAFKKGRTQDEEIVYHNFNGGEVKHPKSDMPVPPSVPYGSASEIRPGDDRRIAFVNWLASAENPYFAKSMTNRIWSYFFGLGIIDPVDDIRASNPPSNPALLDALTEDFVKSNYDLRKLMRTIVLSRAYQRSISTNKWNEDDKVNFSHALPRRLTAEQLVDAVAVATGHRPKFGGMPANTRAVNLPDGTGESADVLGLFGKPKRESACECERTMNFTLAHAINLVNGPTIGEAVSSPTNKIADIINREKDDKAAVTQIYLSILNRPPTPAELDAAYLGEKRLEAAQDIAWALLNSAAFLYNR